MASQKVHDRLKRAEHRAALVVERELTPLERERRIAELSAKWRDGLSEADRSRFDTEVSEAKEALATGDRRPRQSTADFRQACESKYGPNRDKWPQDAIRSGIWIHMVRKTALEAQKEQV